jgi:myo-inositol 2-dehydrogenase/D-chiro-inositol 1-dehydrogenase
MDPISLGFVGAGRIGTFHATYLLQLGLEIPLRITWVADLHAANAERLAAAVGAANWTTELEELFKSDVEAVVVAANTAAHSRCLELAAQYSKHIWCEKPAGLSSEELLRSKKLLEGAAVKHMIGFQKRFDADTVEILRKIEADEIGELYSLTLQSRDPYIANIEFLRTCGGLMKDMAIHDFDLIHALMPFPIKSVTAVGRFNNPAMAAMSQMDTASVFIEHVGDRWSYMSFSREACFAYDQRFELFGTKGSLVSKVHPVSAVEICTSTSLTSEVHFAREIPFFVRRHWDNYISELKTFLLYLRGIEGQRVDIDNAIEAMILAEAATLSLETGKKVDFEEFRRSKLGLSLAE